MSKKILLPLGVVLLLGIATALGIYFWKVGGGLKNDVVTPNESLINVEEATPSPQKMQSPADTSGGSGDIIEEEEIVE